LAENKSFVLVSSLVAAYGLGVLLLEWADRGAFSYIQARVLPMTSRARTLRARLARAGHLRVLYVFHGMPLPRIELSYVELQIKMFERIESAGGVYGLPEMWSPWDKMETYRTLLRRAGSERELVLDAATDVHGRLLFCLGMSVASVLTAAQALTSWLVQWRQPSWASEEVSPTVLLCVVLVSIASTVGLRFAAGRYWEHELVLTASVSPSAL
jgi:hypothetical protein